jgi:SAM-dependent methyltransferase
MAASLNLYGDSIVMTTGKHGADISSQRMDDLDVETILHALQLKERTGACLDLGCGIGIQGLRLASLGFKTMLIDWIPISTTVLRVAGLDELLPLSYLMKDARALESANLPTKIAVCYSQRFIHYLRFDEALVLLKLVRQQMLPGAKLFLSASGLLSELGDNYPGKAHELSSRFAPLSQPMAEKHNIHESVCLYTPDDLVTLCQSASFSCDRVYSSAFGNVKGVFTTA